MKTRRFYSHNDPPFDMKHQLKSADSLPVVKIDLRTKVYFQFFDQRMGLLHQQLKNTNIFAFSSAFRPRFVFLILKKV